MRFENNTDNIFHRRDYSVIISVLFCAAHPVSMFIYKHDWGYILSALLLWSIVLLPVVFYLRFAPILLSLFFFAYAANVVMEYAAGNKTDLAWHLLGILVWGSLTFIVDYRWARHSWK